MYIYTREYHSAIKIERIIKLIVKCMNLEKITWNKVTQAPKDEYNIYLLICECELLNLE